MDKPDVCAICDGDWSESEIALHGARVVCLGDFFHAGCFEEHFGFKPPAQVEEKDVCPECGEEVDASSTEKIILKGAVHHVPCYRQKYGVKYEESAKPQDDPDLPNCPICDTDVHKSDNATWVGGRPYHSQCYKEKYGEEKQKEKEEHLDVCPSCGEVVEPQDMQKVIMAGEAWHQGCYRREHVQEHVAKAKPQDDPLLPNCPICDQDVHASDAQAWHGGQPYHSRCWNEKYGTKEEAKEKQVDLCPECGEEADTQYIVVVGQHWHERCYRAKHHIETKASIKPQDDPNLPNCPVCDLDVHPSSSSTYVSGEAYHSHCYRERFGAPVAEEVEEDKEYCPECGQEVEKGTTDKIIVGGTTWHSACYRKANKKMTIRGMKKFVETCRICKEEVAQGQDSLVVRGYAWHRPCYKKFMGLQPAAE